MEEMLSKLKGWINQCDNIVFFGGAGVSTESGIPDFRSANGIYNQQWPEPPEVLLSHDYFLSHPEQFFAFHRQKMIYADAQPNAAHLALAKLEQMGKLKAVITQNIDGLHQAAGSINVLELHGSVHRNYCLRCRKQFDLDFILDSQGVPRCPDCSGIIRPDVVLYQEQLDMNVITAAVNAIKKAQMLIIGGTGLSVYPAAGLVDYYRGNKLALINNSPTARDHLADLIINGKIGEVLNACVDIR